MTYDELLQAMLDRVPDGVDKREGSIIFDALAPCAYYLAEQDFKLDNHVNLVMADTAIDEYLDRAVWPHVTRKQATAAVRKMTASDAVALGTRWGIKELVYVVTAEIDSNTYEVTCESLGAVGNQYSGEIQPVSNVPGVTAVLGDVIVPGTDTEKDEALRERFYLKVRMPATSGNAYQYILWARGVAGVGAARVFPLGNGPGTVVVLVVDDNLAVSSVLPDVVAEYIETVRPVGATVTVESPVAVSFNVSARVLLDGTRAFDAVVADFTASLEVFMKDLVFSRDLIVTTDMASNTYRVSLAKIGNLLIDVDGVDDYDNLLLNGGAGNGAVGMKQIPVLGTVTLTEVSTLES